MEEVSFSFYQPNINYPKLSSGCLNIPTLDSVPLNFYPPSFYYLLENSYHIKDSFHIPSFISIKDEEVRLDLLRIYLLIAGFHFSNEIQLENHLESASKIIQEEITQESLSDSGLSFTSPADFNFSKHFQECYDYIQSRCEDSSLLILFFTPFGFAYFGPENLSWVPLKIIIVVSQSKSLTLTPDASSLFHISVHKPLPNSPPNDSALHQICEFTLKGEVWQPLFNQKEISSSISQAFQTNATSDGLTLDLTTIQQISGSSIGLIGRFNDIISLFSQEAQAPFQHIQSCFNPVLFQYYFNSVTYVILYLPENFSPNHPSYAQISEYCYFWMRRACSLALIVPSTDRLTPIPVNNHIRGIRRSSSPDEKNATLLAGYGETFNIVTSRNPTGSTLQFSSLKELFSWIDWIVKVGHFSLDVSIGKNQNSNIAPNNSDNISEKTSKLKEHSIDLTNEIFNQLLLSRNLIVSKVFNHVYKKSNKTQKAKDQYNIFDFEKKQKRHPMDYALFGNFGDHSPLEMTDLEMKAKSPFLNISELIGLANIIMKYADQYSQRKKCVICDSLDPLPLATKNQLLQETDWKNLCDECCYNKLCLEKETQETLSRKGLYHSSFVEYQRKHDYYLISVEKFISVQKHDYHFVSELFINWFMEYWTKYCLYSAWDRLKQGNRLHLHLLGAERLRTDKTSEEQPEASSGSHENNSNTSVNNSNASENNSNTSENNSNTSENNSNASQNVSESTSHKDPNENNSNTQDSDKEYFTKIKGYFLGKQDNQVGYLQNDFYQLVSTISGKQFQKRTEYLLYLAEITFICPQFIPIDDIYNDFYQFLLKYNVFLHDSRSPIPYFVYYSNAAKIYNNANTYIKYSEIYIQQEKARRMTSSNSLSTFSSSGSLSSLDSNSPPPTSISSSNLPSTSSVDSLYYEPDIPKLSIKAVKINSNFTIDVETSFNNSQEFTFWRVFTSDKIEHYAQPTLSQKIAKLAYQPSDARIINSWSLSKDNGILALIYSGDLYHLIFLSNGFNGKYPTQEILSLKLSSPTLHTAFIPSQKIFAIIASKPALEKSEKFRIPESEDTVNIDPELSIVFYQLSPDLKSSKEIRRRTLKGLFPIDSKNFNIGSFIISPDGKQGAIGTKKALIEFNPETLSLVQIQKVPINSNQPLKPLHFLNNGIVFQTNSNLYLFEKGRILPFSIDSDDTNIYNIGVCSTTIPSDKLYNQTQDNDNNDNSNISNNSNNSNNSDISNNSNNMGPILVYTHKNQPPSLQQVIIPLPHFPEVLDPYQKLFNEEEIMEFLRESKKKYSQSTIETSSLSLYPSELSNSIILPSFEEFQSQIKDLSLLLPKTPSHELSAINYVSRLLQMPQVWVSDLQRAKECKYPDQEIAEFAIKTISSLPPSTYLRASYNQPSINVIFLSFNSDLDASNIMSNVFGTPFPPSLPGTFSVGSTAIPIVPETKADAIEQCQNERVINGKSVTGVVNVIGGVMVPDRNEVASDVCALYSALASADLVLIDSNNERCEKMIKLFAIVFDDLNSQFGLCGEKLCTKLVFVGNNILNMKKIAFNSKSTAFSQLVTNQSNDIIFCEANISNKIIGEQIAKMVKSREGLKLTDESLMKIQQSAGYFAGLLSYVDFIMKTEN